MKSYLRLRFAKHNYEAITPSWLQPEAKGNEEPPEPHIPTRAPWGAIWLWLCQEAIAPPCSSFEASSWCASGFQLVSRSFWHVLFKSISRNGWEHAVSGAPFAILSLIKYSRPPQVRLLFRSLRIPGEQELNHNLSQYISTYSLSTYVHKHQRQTTFFDPSIQPH